MGGTFRLLTPPDILHCLRLQQDCRQQGKISSIEATNELAMFEGNRGKFQLLKPTVSLPCIKIQQDCRQQRKFKYLKPPMSWRCLKIHQDCREQGGFKLLKPQYIWPCVRIQQDSRQATNNCAMSEKYNKIAGNRGKISSIEAD